MGSSSVESGQVSYIFPSSESHPASAHSWLFRWTKWTKTCSENGHQSGKLWRYFALAASLVVVAICSLVWVHGRLAGWDEGVQRWDSGRMGRLQTVLLAQARELMVTTNRSIHDPLARQMMRNLSREDEKTCYSPNCLHTGISLLESMNFKIDPCQNFYDFACGSWTHSSPGEHNVPLVVNSDQFSKINEKVIRATQNILEDPAPETEIGTFPLAQKFYFQCKDLNQLEKDGLDALWALMEKYGGWPILGSQFQFSAPSDWLALVADLQRMSCSSILSLEVKQHPVHSLQNVIYLIHPKFFIAREYLLNPTKYPKIFTAYKTFIVALAAEFVKFGDGALDWEQLHADAENMIEFESALAKLATDEVESTRPVRKAQYSIHKLQRETDLLTPKSAAYPNQLNWKKYLGHVFVSSGMNFTDEERIVVQDVSYIRGLSPLLANTPTTTLTNYLMWRLLVTFTSGTTHKLRKLNFNFYNMVYGMKRIPPRASTCATVVKDTFALAIGMKIVRGLTDISSKKEVEEMVDNVRIAMERLLNNKQLGPVIFPLGISRKLSTLKHCIGYPSSFHNVTAIDQFYESLRFNNESEIYLKKYVRLRFWLYDKTLTTLREPFDSDCWSGTSWANIGEAYAYYDTARNSINFPIGLLQAPFYRHNVPIPVNYGAIGAIIGHEISHSVNIEGWIKVGLVQKLEEYWECLEHHYSTYHVPSLGPDSRVNGLRTRSENLADHLGLAASYWAFRKLSSQNNHEFKSLVGLDIFSHDQMFFLSFAHMWCVNGPDEWLADELESSSHTPGIYRVLGSLQNSDDFAKSWSCPVGSGMNPVDKCNSLITSSSEQGKNSK
ncbi:endothelin-converting enzyme homolog [Folsomia candida]|uniref:Endothelin-converting enzyme 1 n=1 Tax=Folsomia candida TaxID=158441 RepID=A0A226D2V2_FOLCA|nr:endothelin-converting enzyme homolog [Folsomia candida]OXA38981.1 Endothelin-converting enzyme 1 [Folsomia candida]